MFIVTTVSKESRGATCSSSYGILRKVALCTEPWKCMQESRAALQIEGTRIQEFSTHHNFNHSLVNYLKYMYLATLLYTIVVTVSETKFLTICW